MPLESGGRADKYGNRYETEFVVSQLLNLYEEEIIGLMYEPLGEDESAVDLVIYHEDNTKELAQCKMRNSSKEYWTVGDLNTNNILKKWKEHLDRLQTNVVSLVTPLIVPSLQDMISRSKTNNNDPEVFYNQQILTSSQKFQNEFSTFCRVMELDKTNTDDLYKAVNYLRRIKIVNFPDNSTNDLKYRINRLFVGNREDNYNQLYSAIDNEDIYGRFINISSFSSFMKKKEIQPKTLSRDERIAPQIERLNREFEEATKLIGGNIIERESFKEVHQSIEDNESVILHGSAGNGKTVATLNAIEYCKKNKIPYLAIKLDKNPPKKSTAAWGKDMGLPDTISLCLDSISKDSPAVLILDQLDSLRWTQSHSSKSLEVCKEIIREVESINRTRDKKISIIFVCRSYDLNNDSQITQIFDNEHNMWSKIEIDKLSEKEVSLSIGDVYNSLTSKTKELLKTPSNLFIWRHLSVNHDYSTEYSSTYELVNDWWQNIETNWQKYGNNESKIISIRDELVQFINHKGKQYAPKNLFSQYSTAALKYLASQSFINIQQNKVSFIHQSIYDSLVADNMIEKYYDDYSITEILGNIEEQTPSTKYQVQLFLEYLFSYDTYDFIRVGQEIYEAVSVRFFIKYTFLEILSGLENSQLNTEITNFILEKVKETDYQKYLIQDVLFGHSGYVSLLRENGILSNWLKDRNLKYKAFSLLASIYPNYLNDDIDFIEGIVLNDEELASQFSRHYSWEFEQDTDRFFEFRLRFAEKYPEQVIRQYFDFGNAYDKHEIRTIKIIRFLYDNQDKAVKQKASNGYLEGIENKNVTNYKDVLKHLLPIIPEVESKIEMDMEWFINITNERTIERTIISLIKKSNAALIKKSPEEFIEMYKLYFGSGSVIYNELFLEAFYYMDEQYSEKIIEYLFEDIDCNFFDDSSEEQNSLTLGKKILEKHSKYISEDSFINLEQSIMNYKPSDMFFNYKGAVKYRQTERKDMFRSFWGDFQYELLRCLPIDRLSSKSKELLQVLERKFPEGTTRYIRHYPSLGGFMTSEISNKNLGVHQWKKILSDNNLPEKLSASKPIWGTDRVSENTLYGFASDLRQSVSKKPREFIDLYLNMKQSNVKINILFERAFFSGVEQSEELSNVSMELLENLIHVENAKKDTEICKDICRIVSKLEARNWSENTISFILKLAIEHEDPLEYNGQMITSFDEGEDLTHENLINNYYSSVRGLATDALIATFENNNLSLNGYKKIAKSKVKSHNLVDQYGALNLYVMIFKENKNWATPHIIDLYRDNIILFGHHASKNLAHIIYQIDQKEILDVIIQAFESDLNQSIKNASYTLIEFYIRYGKFGDYFTEDSLSHFSENQINAILEMLIIYLGIKNYKNNAKEILLLLLDLKLFNRDFTTSIFRDGELDTKIDIEFMIKLINYDTSGQTYYSFTRYLQESKVSFINYTDVIIESSKKLINSTIETNEQDVWGISRSLPTLVIHLYDEVANNQTEKEIAQKCLNIWDDMYEFQIGNTRRMSKEIMER